jgi:hypothetical protein
VVLEIVDAQLDELERRQRVSAPDPVPRQPVLVMESSKEDGGLPPQVAAKQPDAVADVPEAKPQPLAQPPYRPMLEGDRRREAIRARNQEALRRFEAEINHRP